jgi:hypothetical protein
MEKLPLDDSRWLELDVRSTTPYVMRLLRQLAEKPGDYDLFSELWPYFNSEGTVWNGSYAVAPYFIEFAQEAPDELRFEYAVVVGLMASSPETIVPEFLQDGWQQAKQAAFILLLEALQKQNLDVTTLRYVFAAIAALKGQEALCNVLEDLDCCENCGPQLDE